MYAMPPHPQPEGGRAGMVRFGCPGAVTRHRLGLQRIGGAAGSDGFGHALCRGFVPAVGKDGMGGAEDFGGSMAADFHSP